MAWEKIEKGGVARIGRRPNMLPSISRSTKNKDIGHLTIPVGETAGHPMFDVLIDKRTGDMGFEFKDVGEYKVQPIKTNVNMVRLNIPKKMLGDCPDGTRKVELRRDEGYLVLDRSYLQST